METLFPELPDEEVIEDLDDIEKKEIGAKIIQGWLNKIEGFRDPNNRLAYALKNSNFSAARKKKLAKRLWLLKSIDDILFGDARRIKRKVDILMTGAGPPGTKKKLDSVVSQKFVPVSIYTRKYMNFRCKKQDATFSEFKETYETGGDK